VKVTREQGLRTWASRWRVLKAWRRDLSEVQVEISDRWHANRLGTCWAHQQRLVVYKGTSFIGDLSTLVHELAHAATIGAAHDERWQAIYAAAVTEITGVAVVPVAYNYEVLDRAAEDAMRVWWQASGNAALWRLARGAA
jgi:hypothetical protein